MTNLSVSAIKEAIQIKEQIEKLESHLNRIMRGSTIKLASAPVKTGRRKFSPASLAKMRAAQQARWAKVKGKAPTPVTAIAAPAAKKGGLTPEGRAKLAASMKARWAAKRKDAPKPASKAAPAPKKKPVLTPEGRAKLAALMKARWAARKKGAVAPNAAKK